MSYILDALRKSDMQRQHGTAPTLRTTPVHARTRARRHGWIFGLLGALLVAAGIAIGWLQPWVTARSVADAPHLVAPTTVKPAEVPTPPPVPAASVLTQEPRTPPEDNGRPPRPTPATAKKQAALRPAPANVAAARASDSKVMAMSELPVAIQQEIGAMTVAVHAYSPRAADRMVSINNSVLREGAIVQPGLKLDEITPDGMVLSYKGYRFKRGVQN